MPACAKAGLLCIPFLLKALVDGLDTSADQLALQVVLLLVVAYGAARFSNALLRTEGYVGRVTEKAMHSIGLQTFRHVHSLDIDYQPAHRWARAGYQRGTNSINFLLSSLFSTLPQRL